MNKLEDFEKQQLPIINEQLNNYLKKLNCNEKLRQAMIYSVNAGGKRIRPLLVLLTLSALTEKITETSYQVACSLELLHTYSLIHDDLPEMDNDDLRRGKPTNHKKFGQAMAVLAGDGLLTAAFEWLATTNISNEKKVRLISQLAIAAGPRGMVSGQVEDIIGESKVYTLTELQNLHLKKTGALLRYACLAGGILGNANEKQLALFDKYGSNFGLAFQIYDDLLDVIGDEKKLGKRVNKDIDENKNTYPILLGVDGAIKALNNVILETKELFLDMEKENIKVELLKELLNYFKLRK